MAVLTCCRRIYPPRSLEGLPNAEVHPQTKVGCRVDRSSTQLTPPPRARYHHRGIQWMEYVEAGRTMKYNPVTGETRGTTESTEPGQTDVKAFSPGSGSAHDPGRVRERVERPASEYDGSYDASRSQPLGGKSTENWPKTKGVRNLPAIAINLVTMGPPVPLTIQPRRPLQSRPYSRHSIPRTGQSFNPNLFLPVRIRCPVYPLPLPQHLMLCSRIDPSP